MSTDVKIPQALTQTHHPDAKGVKLPIYMDNHATTQMDPRVLEEMLPYFVEKFGNSASRNHSFGWAAEEGVETARERIAKLIGATTKEIIFTSGATESDNLAIKGVAEMYREKGNHIITAVTEHKAVLDTCKRLEQSGCEVTYLPVSKDGLIDLDELRRAITPKTILISIMHANNEIGVLQPVREIGQLCHAVVVVEAPGLIAVRLTLGAVLCVGFGFRLFLCLGSSAAREKKRHQDQRRTAHGCLLWQEVQTIGIEPTNILI